MHVDPVPTLTPDELDDCLYFSRVNESEDLWQTISALAERYQCTSREIIVAAKDPDSGNTVLHYCSANGFLDLLKALLTRLEHSQQVDGRSKSAQSVASEINVSNAQGNTPLHWAALNGHLDVVKALIAAGADPSIHNAAGHSAVFEAERAGKGLVVEYLFEVTGLEMDPEDVAENVDDVSNEENDEEIRLRAGDVDMDEAGPSG